MHAESIDSLFDWFNHGMPEKEVPSLINIPANQIMEQLLLENDTTGTSFSNALQRFRINHSLPENDYLLNDAFKMQKHISMLRDSLANSDATLTKESLNAMLVYFPTSFTPSSNYTIFFTATGWKWGDAMTFNYLQEGNRYKVTKEGIPSIIFNLAIISSSYGKTIEAQIETYTKVLRHELFHALLEDFIKDKDYYNPNSIESNTLFMLMNEGIAHYLADREYIKQNYTSLKEKESASFGLLSEKVKTIFDSTQEYELRNTTYEEGLFGRFWEKYLCIPGLFMAYHIEQAGGEILLRECMEKGPNYFVDQYAKISKERNDIPIIPITISNYLIKNSFR